MSHGITHQKKHQKSNGKKKAIRELKYAEENEQYVMVIAPKGSGVFEVADFENRDPFLAKITGSFKSGPNKEIIRAGDTVKIQNGITPGQYFINHLYTTQDVDILIKNGEIKKKVASSREIITGEDIDFTEETTMNDISDI